MLLRRLSVELRNIRILYVKIMKTTAGSFRFGPFEFKPAQQQLRGPSGSLTLTPALNSLLSLFVSRPGMLISRDEIARTLWDDDPSVDITNGINSAIRRLRVQLENGTSESTFIAAVVGWGYRFCAPVTFVPDEAEVETPSTDSGKGASNLPPLNLETAASATAAEALSSPRRPRQQRMRIAVFTMCGLALLVVGIAGWWHFFMRPQPLEVDGDHWPDNITRDVTQRIFDEPEDLLTMEALAPSGTRLANVDHAGLSVQIVADHTEHLVAIPPAFAISHISWFPNELSPLVSGFSSPDSKPEVWMVSLNGDARRRPSRMRLWPLFLPMANVSRLSVSANRKSGSPMWTVSSKADWSKQHRRYVWLPPLVARQP